MSADGHSYSEAGSTAAGVTTLKVDGLEENKPYYFRVYALGDGDMRSVNSPVLQTMTSDPFNPDKSVILSPAQNSEVKILDVVLSWKNDTKEYFGNITYNVFLGKTTDTLEEVASEISETSFRPESLEENATYFWRVDAINDNGVTEGDLWSFKAVPGGTLFYTDFHTCLL